MLHLFRWLRRILWQPKREGQRQSALSDEEREAIKAAAARGVRRTFLPRAGRGN
jgi:hypothetical protein